MVLVHKRQPSLYPPKINICVTCLECTKGLIVKTEKVIVLRTQRIETSFPCGKHFIDLTPTVT